MQPFEDASSTYLRLSKNFPHIPFILVSFGIWLLAMVMLRLSKKAFMFTDSANKFGELLRGTILRLQLHSMDTSFFTWNIVWMKHGWVGGLQLIWAARARLKSDSKGWNCCWLCHWFWFPWVWDEIYDQVWMQVRIVSRASKASASRFSSKPPLRYLSLNSSLLIFMESKTWILRILESYWELCWIVE